MKTVFLLGFILMGMILPAQDNSISGSVPIFIGDYRPDAPAWLLRNWGRAAREERELSDAFLLLTRALEKDPGNPETLTEIALSHLRVAICIRPGNTLTGRLRTDPASAAPT